MRERKRRPSLMVISDRDEFIKKLLAEFQRHDVSKKQVIAFLLYLYRQYHHNQDSLILSGGTDSLKAIVKLNKTLEEVVYKLQTTVADENEFIRGLAEDNPSWQQFATALTGKDADAT